MAANLTLTQSIGQAENALRAILDRILAQTRITFVQWVMLNMISRGESGVAREQLVRQIAGALKLDEQPILAALGGLTTRTLITGQSGETGRVALTAAGEELFHTLRQRIESVAEHLYGDLPAEELAITRRILEVVTERANVELRREEPSAGGRALASAPERP
jgi:DNA-binding MarR family transcriptional regulator